MQHHLHVRESYTVDYAGFWLRLGAIIIDGGILWGLNYLMTGLWNLASGLPWAGLTQQMIEEGITTVSLWWLRSLIFLLVLVFYFVGFWAWRGQTPGKMVFRVKVTRFDGSPIGWGGAFLRFCGYIISVMTLLIGFFWMAFDGRRQGIHDKVAETFVVRIPTRKELTAWRVSPQGRAS
ncbi:MAG: RDD family protein [Dehalococcoidia bacterium]|nr:RDD family protein [Dehalococcoidia bacterium]